MEYVHKMEDRPAAGRREVLTFILKVVACSPTYVCFSFTRNHPKQLRGNSDKEPQVACSSRARRDPASPKASIIGLQ